MSNHETTTDTPLGANAPARCARGGEEHAQ